MSFICGLIWCVIALSVCFLTTKYYMPFYIDSKKKTNSSDNPDNSEKTDEKKALLSDKRHKVIALIIVGLFSAVCGYFAYINSTSVINLIKLSIGLVVLVAVGITDIQLMVIPNLFVLVAIVARLLCLVAEFIIYGMDAWRVLVNNTIAAVIVLVFLFVMSKLTKGGLGAGDVKIYTALGFLCGIGCVFYTLLFTMIISAIFSIVLLILKKKKLKDSFPMGPFICLGYGLSIILALA